MEIESVYNQLHQFSIRWSVIDVEASSLLQALLSTASRAQKYASETPSSGSGSGALQESIHSHRTQLGVLRHFDSFATALVHKHLVKLDRQISALQQLVLNYEDIMQSLTDLQAKAVDVYNNVAATLPVEDCCEPISDANISFHAYFERIDFAVQAYQQELCIKKSLLTRVSYLSAAPPHDVLSEDSIYAEWMQASAGRNQYINGSHDR